MKANRKTIQETEKKLQEKEKEILDAFIEFRELTKEKK